MKLAGRYLSIAQSTAESALLAPLRAKHKLNLNLVTLANDAKRELQELSLPLNPTNLLNTANEIAERIGTYYDDTSGLEMTRWNPRLRVNEEYTTTDPRKDFRR
jgi:hypothetical protein